VHRGADHGITWLTQHNLHRSIRNLQTPGGIMKKTVIAVLLASTLSPALAGGVTESVMETEVIVADTASSGGDNWVGIMMTLLVFGAAVAGR
jgi:hypothetical protein